MQIKLTSHAALSLATDSVVSLSSVAGQRIHLSSDELDGHWITVGSHAEDGDEERHGGAHVFVRDGKIEKGPKSLTGKSIGQLKSRAGQSKLGGKSTPMDRTREKLRKLNDSAAPAKGKPRIDYLKEHAAKVAAEKHPASKGNAPEAKAIAEKLNEAIGHPAGPEVEKQVNAEREAQRAAGEAEGRARAAKAKAESAPPEPAAKPKATSSPAARSAGFHDRVKELRGQGMDTARAVAKARGEIEAANPSMKQAAVTPKAVRPAMHVESANVVKAESSASATPATKAEEAPAMDFHERVKQLRGQGKSMTGAVVRARQEATARATAKTGHTVVGKSPEMDAARAAHVAGDAEALKKHVAEAVKKKPPVESWRNKLRGEIKDAYAAQGGGLPVDVYQHAETLQNPYTFKRGSAYAGEVRAKLGMEGGKEGVGIARSGAINFTDDASKSGGEDAIQSFRDKFGDSKGEDYYWKLARERSGAGLQDALEHARNSPDPELRFKAAVHDTLPVGEKVARESVEASSLKVGEEFTINKIPVEVKENADGEKILQDHGDLPETPVDAIQGKIAVDKGTRHEKELPKAGDDFFDEVKGAEPELKSHAAQSLTSDVDTSRQFGMFAKDASGNPLEVGERAGQANLFNPSKFKAAEKPVEEKVKPQFDPRHTMQMFPAGAKSQVAKAIANPAQDALGNKTMQATASRPIVAPAQTTDAQRRAMSDVDLHVETTKLKAKPHATAEDHRRLAELRGEQDRRRMESPKSYTMKSEIAIKQKAEQQMRDGKAKSRATSSGTIIEMKSTAGKATSGDAGANLAKPNWMKTKADLRSEAKAERNVRDKPTDTPATGKIYYHVVPGSYEEGQPIYSGRRFEEATGKKVKNKWSDAPQYKEHEDFSNVALHETLGSAEDFNEEHRSGRGKILAVHVPEGARLFRNSERYPSVRDEVPAEWIVGRTSHEMEVKRAIAGGKSVPPEVMADYPKLGIRQTAPKK